MDGYLYNDDGYDATAIKSNSLFEKKGEKVKFEQDRKKVHHG